MPAATNANGARIGRRDLELPQRADDELDRALDQRAAIRAVPERVAAEQLAQRDLDVVARRRETSARSARTSRAIGLRRHELAPQLADDELRRLRPREQQVEHGVAVEAPGAARARSSRRRRAGAGANDERAGLAVEAPAGERARRFLDVRFGVVALAEREQLHHLAREVLVRRALAVLRAVEVDEHRRILRRRVQQRGEVAERIGARSVAFCAYMSRAKRTFCWLETKWLCQNSVMRSVSGDGVASISRIHQARSSSAAARLLLAERPRARRRRRRAAAGRRDAARRSTRAAASPAPCALRASRRSTRLAARQSWRTRGPRRRSGRSPCGRAGGARRSRPSAIARGERRHRHAIRDGQQRQGQRRAALAAAWRCSRNRQRRQFTPLLTGAARAAM